MPANGNSHHPQKRRGQKYIQTLRTEYPSSFTASVQGIAQLPFMLTSNESFLGKLGINSWGKEKTRRVETMAGKAMGNDICIPFQNNPDKAPQADLKH